MTFYQPSMSFLVAWCSICLAFEAIKTCSLLLFLLLQELSCCYFGSATPSPLVLLLLLLLRRRRRRPPPSTLPSPTPPPMPPLLLLLLLLLLLQLFTNTTAATLTALQLPPVLPHLLPFHASSLPAAEFDNECAGGSSGAVGDHFCCSQRRPSPPREQHLATVLTSKVHRKLHRDWDLGFGVWF